MIKDLLLRQDKCLRTQHSLKLIRHQAAVDQAWQDHTADGPERVRLEYDIHWRVGSRAKGITRDKPVAPLVLTKIRKRLVAIRLQSGILESGVKAVQQLFTPGRELGRLVRPVSQKGPGVERVFQR